MAIRVWTDRPNGFIGEVNALLREQELGGYLDNNEPNPRSQIIQVQESWIQGGFIKIENPTPEQEAALRKVAEDMKNVAVE